MRWVFASMLMLTIVNRSMEHEPEPELGRGVAFYWDAPASECPGAAEVLAALEQRLGESLERYEGGRLTTFARVRLEADGDWNLGLWMITDVGTSHRSIDGENCAALADFAVLLSAMALASNIPDPQSDVEPDLLELTEAEVSEPEQVEPQSPVVPAKDPEPLEREPLEREPTRAPKRRPNIGIGAHTGISVGDLPKAGPVVGVTLGLQWWSKSVRRGWGPGARFELRGQYGFLRRVRLPDHPSQWGSFQHGLVMLRGCPVWRHQRAKIEVPLCVGVEVGNLYGHAEGLQDDRRGSIPWVAVDSALRLVWLPIEHLAIGLDAAPWVAVVRPGFVDTEGRLIWRATPVGFHVMVGLEARF